MAQIAQTVNSAVVVGGVVALGVGGYFLYQLYKGAGKLVGEAADGFAAIANPEKTVATIKKGVEAGGRLITGQTHWVKLDCSKLTGAAKADCPRKNAVVDCMTASKGTLERANCLAKIGQGACDALPDKLVNGRNAWFECRQAALFKSCGAPTVGSIGRSSCLSKGMATILADRAKKKLTPPSTTAYAKK